jgi:hypothetical protein
MKRQAPSFWNIDLGVLVLLALFSATAVVAVMAPVDSVPIDEQARFATTVADSPVEAVASTLTIEVVGTRERPGSGPSARADAEPGVGAS